MDQESLSRERVVVDVKNVGGIDESRVEFTPGVTVLVGRNATNRTSFLRALMAALGSDRASLKSDAETGHVELTIGEVTYERSFRRTDAGVTTDGDPYLDDPMLADLFAFLLETNEARQAVSRAADLRELIMRPVDTDAITAEIERLRARKGAVREDLDALDELEDERTRLERELAELDSKRERLGEDRDEKVAALETYDRDIEETHSETEALETALEELNDVRTDLESVRFEIETHRESIEILRDERESLRETLADPDVDSEDRVGRVDERLDALREHKREQETLINDLQRIVRLNEGVLDGTDGEITVALGDTEGDPTDALLGNEAVVCWSCGSAVETDQIQETIDRLRERRDEASDRRRELQAEIAELTDRKRELETQRRDREETRRRLERTESEIDEREAAVEELRERRGELTERITELESDVERLDVVDTYEEMLREHRELNHLEFELDRLAEQREAIETELDTIDDQLAERPRLESQLETITDELAAQRTTIERIETEAVEHFNEHMERVLEILEYDNLERIWIERTVPGVDGNRRPVESAEFDLHVVRSTDADVAYEDSIDHLSESEREVTGLVFALAGYLVHEVYDAVPFILMDSLEAIDANRIARLVEYVAEYADSLVVALLPEDAAALDAAHERITEI